MVSVNAEKTLAAVVITRNRIAFLRRTLKSLQESTYPLALIIVSDDSTNDATERMLRDEFPSVKWLAGPKRGRAANRNHGIRAASTNFVLVSDDDVIVNPDFARLAIQKSADFPDGLYFPRIEENGMSYLPNGLDFLGFLTKPYSQGAKYHSANSQCFLIAKAVFINIEFDEMVSIYGYEEIDYAYRVAAAGFPIIPLTDCICHHIDPNPNEPFRIGQDASRIYVTYKRYRYVDRQPLKATAFMLVSIPHHFLVSFKRAGWRGLAQAWANVAMAVSMLRQRSGREES